MRNDKLHPRIQYIQDLFTHSDKFLQMSIEAAESLDMPINIGPEEGKLLQFFVKSIGATKALEIGTLTGYSAIWIARALSEGGILYSLEKTLKHAEIARNIINKASLDKIVKIIDGNAEHILPQLEVFGLFDFIFIDANKSSYPYYLEWAKQNIRIGGIIVADNTYLFDSVYLAERPSSVTNTMWNQMKKFNEIAAKSENFESIMIPTLQGMTILLKN